MSVFFLKNNPDIVETYYSKFLYEIIGSSKNIFFDLTNFPTGEVLYFAFIFSILFYLIKKIPSINFIISSTLSVICFFYVSWGLNYFRIPLEKHIAKEFLISEEKVEKLTLFFSVQCNKLKQEINSKHNKFNYLNSYKSLIESESKKFKYSNLSLILSYMGIKGYYNPFTNEANVNSRIPKILIPVTIYHELAHKKGYASESDANFLGFLKAYNNSNIEIQYSANFFALQYLFNDLKKRDPSLAKNIFESLSNDVKNDFLVISNFWRDYYNRFQITQKKIFDLFLKSQGQKKGINSYNEVVKLLIFTFDGKNKFILDENIE